MVGHLITLGLGIFVIFGGLAIILVGLIGRYLDRFHLVSYTMRTDMEPKPHHRCITAGLGVIILLIGTALFSLEIFLLSRMR